MYAAVTPINDGIRKPFDGRCDGTTPGHRGSSWIILAAPVCGSAGRRRISCYLLPFWAPRLGAFSGDTAPDNSMPGQRVWERRDLPVAVRRMYFPSVPTLVGTEVPAPDCVSSVSVTQASGVHYARPRWTRTLERIGRACCATDPVEPRTCGIHVGCKRNGSLPGVDATAAIPSTLTNPSRQRPLRPTAPAHPPQLSTLCQMLGFFEKRAGPS